jgi:mRNA interferase MazF
MRHGEVWAYNDGRKALVISSDEHNDMPGAAPFVAPIMRTRAPTASAPLMVATNGPDPVSGTIVVPLLTSTPGGAPAECVGMVTGQTMASVGDGLRVLFDL